MNIELSECGNYLKQGILLYKREYGFYGKHFVHCMTMHNASIKQMIEAYEQQSKLVDKALSNEKQNEDSAFYEEKRDLVIKRQAALEFIAHMQSYGFLGPPAMVYADIFISELDMQIHEYE